MIRRPGEITARRLEQPAHSGQRWTLWRGPTRGASSSHGPVAGTSVAYHVASRIALVLGILLAAGAATLLGVTLVTSLPPQAQPAAPPTIAAVGNHLTSDLQQVMDAVTPKPPDLNPSTTAQLQSMVNIIAKNIARGDIAAASASLSALQNQVVADRDGQLISSDRVALIQTAVTQLSGELAALPSAALGGTSSPLP